MRRPLAASIQVLAVVLFALAGGSCGAGSNGVTPVNCTPGPLPPSVGPMSGAEMTQAMMVFDMVNTHRTGMGLAALTWSAAAAQVAYDHCADMQNRNFFAHTNPGCQTPSDRSTMAGIVWSTHGENIAKGQPDANTVMTDWLNSAGHRANIENNAFTMLGVGMRQGAGGPWWTQVFFAP